ncbi:MAG TPA: NfeD family protein [Candidatus Lustribacter sp.]|nr:NfeD family protein [Candidatus Lustribacter sp.]
MEYAWLVWLGVAIALAAVEAATVDFVFVMLAGGALGGAAAAGLGASFPVQAVVAVVTAVALLAVVRPWAQRTFTVTRDTKIGAAGQIGRSAFVLERVTETDGRVKLAGETWSARSGDGHIYHPGDEVRVASLDGATAVVISAAAPSDPAR